MATTPTCQGPHHLVRQGYTSPAGLDQPLAQDRLRVGFGIPWVVDAILKWLPGFRSDYVATAVAPPVVRRTSHKLPYDGHPAGRESKELGIQSRPVVYREAPPVTRVTRTAVTDRRPLIGRWLTNGVIVASIALFGLSVGVPAASAHGGSPSNEGYILVQQALGHLAHGITGESIHLAMDKIDAALVVKDQEGVAVAEVNKAKRALAAGQIEQTRALLQGSIKEALSMLKPATGEQTGTTIVIPELPGREGLTGGDWAMLAASLVLLLAGIGLAFRFRPHDTVGELRQRLGASPIAVGDAAGNPTHVETEL